MITIYDLYQGTLDDILRVLPREIPYEVVSHDVLLHNITIYKMPSIKPDYTDKHLSISLDWGCGHKIRLECNWYRTIEVE